MSSLSELLSYIVEDMFDCLRIANITDHGLDVGSRMAWSARQSSEAKTSAALARVCELRPVRTTPQPSETSARATAKPMPRAPPVITATCPASRACA